MTRILHASFLRHFHESIASQLTWENEAAEILNIDLDTVLVVSEYEAASLQEHAVLVPLKIKRSRFKLLRWVRERYAYAKWLTETSRNYDVVLVRWNVSNPFQLIAIMRMKAAVYTVHHTFEGHEARLSESFGKLRSVLDRMIFQIVAQKVSGVIGVTQEIVSYEVDRARKPLVGFVYPNGISCSDSTKLEGMLGIESPPEIVFVATHFSAWQGLDLLLASVTSSKMVFVLHLVGNLSADQMKIAGADDRIICHGTLPREKLVAIYQRSDVGLSSFALARKGMKQATSLKVREYLSFGVPVYSGHQDIFPSSFPFYRIGPPDIDQVIEFSAENNGTSRAEIRALSEPYIDKSNIVDRLYKQLLARHSR